MFLSGLPEVTRKRRHLLVIQAYIDDSGVKGTDPVLVLAGFLSSAEKWAAFFDDWKKQLEAHPSIAYLKMNEAARTVPSGEFYGWSEEDIDAKLRGFVSVLKRYAQRAIYVLIDLEAHTELHIEGPQKDAFYTAATTMLSAVCFDCLDEGIKEEIEIIFDTQVIFGPRLALWYPAIKDALNQSANEDQRDLARVLPPSPLFRDDHTFYPLQAADVLAWLLRHAFSGNRNRFEWIAEELMPTIPMSPYSSIFTRERMEGHIEESKTVSFSQEHLAKWKELLGVTRQKKRKPDTTKINHAIWRPTLAGGIYRQKVAIVGYSHHCAKGTFDQDNLTLDILQGVIDGTRKHSFFTAIQKYFGYDDSASFWSRVYFFNFLAEAIGPSDRKYGNASSEQREEAKRRFLTFIENEKPDKVFIFTRKGWKSFPETTVEEQEGRTCNRLFNDSEEPTWGTYLVGEHRVLACGFRHPQFARGEDLEGQVREFLRL